MSDYGDRLVADVLIAAAMVDDPPDRKLLAEAIERAGVDYVRGEVDRILHPPPPPEPLPPTPPSQTLADTLGTPDLPAPDTLDDDR